MNFWKEILPYVHQPSRYLGNEVNAVHKDPYQVKAWVALAFPDLYEIGMSHLGLKILYHILNQRSDIAAERVFAPGEDFEAQLRRRGYPLCSLESFRPLHQFDIVGFSLQYELSYTNILNMLDLGAIPWRTSQREEDSPLIIGGGPGAFNPEPLAAFFDLFVLGDGEEIILEIVDTYQHWREVAAPKDVLLEEMSKLRGVYIPSFFRPIRGKGGQFLRIDLIKGGNPWIERRVLEDIEEAQFPLSPVVPFKQNIHDRIALEISRGCTQGCRFCQAGILYRPVRERSPARIKELAAISLRNSGYEELSLSSLNVGEYSCLMSLASDLEAVLGNDHISISLPTLRPGALNPILSNGILRGRKTGFTLVPEAATERLRRVINKKVSEEALFQDITQLLQAGWSSFKLYFMIGLPTETQEDIEGIATLCRRILLLPRHNRRIQRIIVSLSPFVPKSHTPFQWLPQEKEAILKEKLRFLQGSLRNRIFELRWHDVSMSFLEAVFSRGNRELGPVLEEAWRRGCKFDGWGDHFSASLWKETFEAMSVDPTAHAYASRPLAETLPWDHLRSGVERKYLEEEYQRGLSGHYTPDCRVENCQDCGLHRLTTICKKGKTSNHLSEKQSEIVNKMVMVTDQSLEGRRQRLRLTVKKMGPFKYLSQLEFSRAFFRACRRAGIPLAYSQGHHPLPRISFGPALPVGVESEGEQIEIELKAFLPPETAMTKLNAKLSKEMQIVSSQEVDGSFPTSGSQGKFEVVLFMDRIPCLAGWSRISYERAIDDLLAKKEIHIHKSKNGVDRVIDIRPSIADIAISSVQEDQVVLNLKLHLGAGGVSILRDLARENYGLRPEEIASLEIKKLRE